MTTTKTPVMISGPGKSGKVIGKAIQRSGDFELLPFAFTKTSSAPIEIEGVTIQCIPLSERANFDVKSRVPSNTLVVDFTLPDAILENVKYYAANGMNFVMGTTGVDKVRNDVEQIIKASGITAVIAANTAAGIVGLQSNIAKFAAANPGGLKGCTIRVDESHQGPDPQRPEFKGKADPSGTAVKLSESFATLGIEGCPFSSKDIMEHPEQYRATTFNMIRDRRYQLEVLKVPAEYLDGHGWHTYSIADPVMAPAFNAFYHGVKNFMKSSPIFNGYTKVERDSTGECTVERRSADGNVFFSVSLIYDPASYGKSPVVEAVIKHNVNGRSVYGDGTLMGLSFLRDTVKADKILSGEGAILGSKPSDGKILSMADVLRLG
jgi:4-hydroxy-tetrahydrodipicolinate reductase